VTLITNEKEITKKVYKYSKTITNILKNFKNISYKTKFNNDFMISNTIYIKCIKKIRKNNSLTYNELKFNIEILFNTLLNNYNFILTIKNNLYNYKSFEFNKLLKQINNEINNFQDINVTYSSNIS